MLIYKNFYICNGGGEDEASAINAFDAALMKAGISEVNLVPVSSILPERCFKLKTKPNIRIGEIVFCVLARLDGIKGEKISAGIACIYGNRGKKNYGLVMEAHGNVNAKTLRRDLGNRIDSMCKLRNFKIKEVEIVIESISKIKNKFGSTIVALIYR